MAKCSGPKNPVVKCISNYKSFKKTVIAAGKACAKRHSNMTRISTCVRDNTKVDTARLKAITICSSRRKKGTGWVQCDSTIPKIINGILKSNLKKSDVVGKGVKGKRKCEHGVNKITKKCLKNKRAKKKK